MSTTALAAAPIDILSQPGARQSLHIVRLDEFNELPDIKGTPLEVTIEQISKHVPQAYAGTSADEVVVLYQIGEWDPTVPTAIVIVDLVHRSWIWQNPANGGTPQGNADAVLTILDLIAAAG